MSSPTNLNNTNNNLYIPSTHEPGAAPPQATVIECSASTPSYVPNRMSNLVNSQNLQLYQIQTEDVSSKAALNSATTLLIQGMNLSRNLEQINSGLVAEVTVLKKSQQEKKARIAQMESENAILQEKNGNLNAALGYVQSNNILDAAINFQDGQEGAQPSIDLDEPTENITF